MVTKATSGSTLVLARRPEDAPGDSSSEKRGMQPLQQPGTSGSAHWLHRKIKGKFICSGISHIKQRPSPTQKKTKEVPTAILERSQFGSEGKGKQEVGRGEAGVAAPHTGGSALKTSPSKHQNVFESTKMIIFSARKELRSDSADPEFQQPSPWWQSLVVSNPLWAGNYCQQKWGGRMCQSSMEKSGTKWTQKLHSTRCKIVFPVPPPTQTPGEVLRCPDMRPPQGIFPLTREPALGRCWGFVKTASINRNTA